VRRTIEAAAKLKDAGTDAFGLVMLHCGASYWAVEAGDLATARTQAEFALDLARQLGNPSAVMSALCNLARSIEHNDPVRALDAFEQAIALGRAGATQLMMGLALVGVARLRSRIHDRPAALEALRDAIRYSNYVGFRPLVVEVLAPGAEILLRVGEHATAVVLAGSALGGTLATIMVSSERNVELERVLVTAREGLGTDQYTRLYARGEAMSYQEVVEFALEELRRATAAGTDARAPRRPPSRPRHQSGTGSTDLRGTSTPKRFGHSP
jgi:hypothetical protein